MLFNYHSVKKLIKITWRICTLMSWINAMVLPGKSNTNSQPTVVLSRRESSSGLLILQYCIGTGRYCQWWLMDWAVDTTDLRITNGGYVDERWGRPILDAQTRLQTSHVKPRAGDGRLPVLRWVRLSCSDRTRLSSKADVCYDDLSAVRVSSSSGCMPQAFMLDFSMSLYRFRCPPWDRVPRSSSPYKAIFGSRVSSIRVTCPVQRKWADIKKALIPVWFH